MAINRGTYEGDIQEIEFVRLFNKNKQNTIFSILTDKLNYNLDNIYMVRVTTNQYSKLSNKITKTRSDCYVVYSEDAQIKNVLKVTWCVKNTKNPTKLLIIKIFTVCRIFYII